MSFSERDVPLYPGRLVGARSFLVTPSGFLTGVAYASRWQAGDNEAMCAIYGQLEEDERTNLYFAPPDHRITSRYCSCGFYAYFSDNSRAFSGPSTAEGIIEAWGKVTIGTQGFRASHARIAALVIPTFPTNWREKLKHRIECAAPWYKAHGWSYPHLAQQAGCELPPFPFPSRIDKILANYPDVRIFETMEEALEAVPPTSVEVAHEICDAA